MSRKVDKQGNPIPYMRGGVIYEHIYELTLYDESENASFDIIFNKVKILFPNVEFVYIYHDKDTLDDGTPKRRHYHLLLVFPRERSIKKLAEDLEVPLNLIEWKAYLNKAVQYLVHLNNPDKAQYDIDSLEGNWNFQKFLGGDFSSNEISEINGLADFVHNNLKHITYYNLFRYASDHNLLKTYKNWYFQLRDMMNDNE